MKSLFASADAGLIGLLFFFAIFVGIALWVYNPTRKCQIEQLKNIPLNNEDDNDHS